ncbi:hypothetical protein IAQ61_004194 [Plenodomus lingam]|uniref:uncharacterized protein n=1 Tax=Leptosphaeria maculans TaxID=5022 RepID=UPI00332D516A|nr:hypothetical protein IAQ61_004194 [Plenodomus lingam]
MIDDPLAVAVHPSINDHHLTRPPGFRRSVFPVIPNLTYSLAPDRSLSHLHNLRRHRFARETLSAHSTRRDCLSSTNTHPQYSAFSPGEEKATSQANALDVSCAQSGVVRACEPPKGR